LAGTSPVAFPAVATVAFTKVVFIYHQHFLHLSVLLQARHSLSVLQGLSPLIPLPRYNARSSIQQVVCYRHFLPASEQWQAHHHRPRSATGTYAKSSPLVTKLTSHSHDLRETFDIIVGKAPLPVERFTVYSSILTQRSRFLHAARKPEWLEDPSKPVDLTTEDPDVFHEYLNLVYLGPEALSRYVDDYVRQTKPFEVLLAFEGLHPKYYESALVEAFQEFGYIESTHILRDSDGRSTGRGYICFTNTEDCARAVQSARRIGSPEQQLSFYKRVASSSKSDCAAVTSAICAGYEALIRLHLLADRLQDLTTANTAITELISFQWQVRAVPEHEFVRIAYESTVKGNPLRILLRDMWVHALPDDGDRLLEGSDYPNEFLQDIAGELMRVALKRPEGISPIDCLNTEPCRYHQHDDQHPLCEHQEIRDE
jgi:RNA recognition motif-containing protein